MDQSKQHPRKPSPRNRKGRGWITAGKIAGFTVLWLVLFGVLAGLTAAGAVAGYVASLVKDDPVRSQKLIEQKIAENAQTGFVYFRDGSLIGQLRSEEDRRPITYDEIPQHIIDAVISIEDKNFFQHIGIDTNGLLRAVKQQLLNESVQTGGSTITQQVARRVFLSLDQTQSRKAKEIFLSLRLERYLSKPEIITAYLNKIPYGNGSSGYQLVGIKAAAKGIFGVDDLNKLNIAQAAYLAGVPQLPSLYSIFTSKGEFKEESFKRAMDRQRLVLRRMLEENKITQAQYQEALAFDIYGSLAKPVEKAYNTYPYLMLEVERQASELLVLAQNPNLTREDLKKKENATLIEDARQQLLRGGYKINTTIDKKVYDLMHDIAENPKNFSPDNKVKGVEQTAAVLLDHKTGAILGMIEGRDFHLEQMNFATQMTRQPGSAMKPIAAYLPALDKGLIQPASVLDDSPIILDNGGSSKHIPKNVNNKYAGLVTARYALNHSLNLPALKIFLNMVTIPEAWKFAKSMGITTLTEDDNHAQTGVIGGLKYGVSVEELTNAYGTIANKGVFNDAYLIQSITTIDGQPVYEHKAEPKRIVSEQSAYLMTDMLSTVITNGSATLVKSKFDKFGKIAIAGKTGTTQNWGDVWFEGYTPDITLGVWAGYEKQIYELSPDGRNRAKLIWSQIMNAVTDAKPELFKTKKFDRPDGIVSMTVSSVSGKLPTELTRSAGRLVTDLFNRKYIPTEEDDSLVKMKYISYDGVNYVPLPETPEDMLREAVMVKRETPIDVLMEQIKAVLGKVKSPRPLSFYLPADAAESAPGKTDPRVDDGSPPPAPGEVSAETVGTNVQISFAPVAAEDVAGYRLYRSSDGTNFEKVENSILAGEPPTFVNVGAGGQAYSYYVTAVDVAGNESARSAVVSTDGSGPGTDPSFPDPGNGMDPGSIDPGTVIDPGSGNGESAASVPSAPTGLKAETSDIGVTLTWQQNPPDEGVTSYQIWFAANERGKYQLLGTSDTNRFEFVSPLSNGWYRVTAVNGKGESPPSATVQAKS
ncbi:carboxypeptidase [Cohnella sp. CFH 77786]|uniref:penicillin-binding protein 1A n=1 Tax=Cohnella sp. CFH 77786 TaxID=2662265 RepID=UPI001C60C854|nr:penicillin-binding protein 1A [Cohnella sp. CFH 77786]MBW5444708.1 carboxypeptidase [Cohnella sp. CFH 77786]